MNIQQALKNTNARVVYGNRWLIKSSTNQYEVHEKKPRQHYSRMLIETNDEEIAVKILLESEED